MKQQLTPAQLEMVVTIDYTNYRGERSKRNVIPISMVFLSTIWHPDKQWLLQARDIDKDEDRYFAPKWIHGWLTYEPTRDDAITDWSALVTGEKITFPNGRGGFVPDHIQGRDIAPPEFNDIQDED